LFADTAVTTTHFLKKCVRVPKLYPETAGSPDNLSKAEMEQAIMIQQANKFKRGAMHFEDYNYELYNKYVLIDPNKIDEPEDVVLSDDPD
jgi:hypothetical protein